MTSLENVLLAAMLPLVYVLCLSFLCSDLDPYVFRHITVGVELGKKDRLMQKVCHVSRSFGGFELNRFE